MARAWFNLQSLNGMNRPCGSHARLLSGLSASVVGIVVLSVALVIGLLTAADFGFTIDEFNANDYGPKALAWYTSGFTDRSQFDTLENWLWGYGPWFQILTAFVQSFHGVDPITARHLLTFLVGWIGLAALLPLGQMTFGTWSGVIAIVLCLTTGYLYGHLFFTPIDVPFMMAMNLAVLAIVTVSASAAVPSWPATCAVGLAIGLAIGTRTAGMISIVYLAGAMLLAALEVALTGPQSKRTILLAMAVRILAALVLAAITAILIWPWLQIGNPFTQFTSAHQHFWTLENVFTFPAWGEMVTTNNLPWYYVPEQWLARLPEGFLLLLVIAIAIGMADIAVFARKLLSGWREQRVAGLREPVLLMAKARGKLVIVAAALIPPLTVITRGSTLYDGVRHLLFVIPMLALVAGGGLVWLIERLRALPAVALLVILAFLIHLGFNARTLAVLHPLEYTAMNSLAGGTQGAYGRFELDYWAAAATEAVRRLEQTLDHDTTGRYAQYPPHVLVCIPWREERTSILFRRNWVVETDPAKADFWIGTERWNCGKDKDVALIDEVTRVGRVFAWTYANRPSK
jgi:hypothetical protein